LYGPLPAPADAGELNHFSALSTVAAFAAALAPFAAASFELTIPVEGFARIAGSAVLGVLERIRTVYGPFALTLIPPSRNEGFPLRLIRRLSEKTTSFEVRGVPSPKCTFFFNWNVKVFASLLAVHD
jgi:hypothetical protein